MDQIKQQIQNDTIIFQSDLDDFIYRKLHGCLNICRDNNKKGDEDSENNWFLLILRITKLRQEFYYMNDPII